MNHPPTTEMMIQGKRVDVEDPTFGITQPSVEEALTPEERRARDQQNKLWAEQPWSKLGEAGRNTGQCHVQLNEGSKL